MSTEYTVVVTDEQKEESFEEAIEMMDDVRMADDERRWAELTVDHTGVRVMLLNKLQSDAVAVIDAEHIGHEQIRRMARPQEIALGLEDDAE